MSARRSIGTFFAVFPLLAFLGVGLILHRTHGHYNATGAIWMTLLGALLLFRPTGKVPERLLWPALCAIALVFTLQLWHDPDLVYAEWGRAQIVLRTLLGTLALATGALFVLALFQRRTVTTRIFFALALGVACLAKGLVIFVSPHPHIDVFTNTTLAVRSLLGGSNPYTLTYPDIYDGHFDYVSTFPYWPGILYWVTPFQALFGDVRFAFVIADGLAALGLWRWARLRQWSFWESAALALAWLVFPVTLFVSEQSWNDSVLAALLVLLWCLLDRRRWAMAGLAAGALLACKQYMVPLVALVGGWTLLHAGRRATILFSGAVILMVTGCLAPFLIADAGAFYQHTVAAVLGNSFRPDSLSAAGYFRLAHGVVLSKGVCWAIPLMTGTLAGGQLARSRSLTLRDLAWGLSLFYLALFLFGQQAFCNYYYFVSFLILLSVP